MSISINQPVEDTLFEIISSTELLDDMIRLYIKCRLCVQISPVYVLNLFENPTAVTELLYQWAGKHTCNE